MVAHANNSSGNYHIDCEIMANLEADKVRSELMRLVPLVATEGRRIVDTIAQQQGLHQTDVEALARVMLAEADARPLTVGVLGGELGLTSGATTFLMKRLAQAGLIERSRHPTDQRKFFVHLTTAGQDLAQTIHPAVMRLSDAVMDAFTPTELETVRRYLAATVEAMAIYHASLSEASVSLVEIPSRDW